MKNIICCVEFFFYDWKFVESRLQYWNPCRRWTLGFTPCTLSSYNRVVTSLQGEVRDPRETTVDPWVGVRTCLKLIRNVINLFRSRLDYRSVTLTTEAYCTVRASWSVSCEDRSTYISLLASEPFGVAGDKSGPRLYRFSWLRQTILLAQGKKFPKCSPQERFYSSRKKTISDCKRLKYFIFYLEMSSWIR